MVMASAPVQQAVGTQAAGTTCTITLGANPSHGNTLIVATYSNAGDVSGVSGGGVTTWTKLVGPGNVSSVWNNVYWGIVDTTPSTTVTVTATSGVIIANASEWPGMAFSLATTGVANGPSAAPAPGSITPTRGPVLVVANVTTGLSLTAGPTDGFTALTLATTGGRTCQAAYRVDRNPAAAAPAWTASGSGSWDAVIGSLRFHRDPMGATGFSG